MKAIWNGQVLAESEHTIVVEGNHYFPEDAIRTDYFSASDKRTFCGWKGEAHYYDVEVGGKTNPAAAWYYPEPMDEAQHIRNRVAFWNGVQITE